MDSTMAPEVEAIDDDITLRVRGMVCARCIDVVHAELTQLGFDVIDTRLGQVHLQGPVLAVDLKRIEQALAKQGFGLIQDQRIAIPQRVKSIIDAVFAKDDLSESKARLSVQLQTTLGLDYDTISGQFAKAEGITLEKYIINRRIDKVKERLVYSDDTLTDIAYRTGYSSVQHLSNQFRQQTGLTPTYFRQVRQQKKNIQQHTA